MSKTIYATGDSWTFGSEIISPEHVERKTRFSQTLKPGKTDWGQDNDSYRIPRIWPTLLGKKLDATVINEAWPSRSNDTIYNTTIGWLLRNYIIPKRDTSDLTVLVGWTSPERKNVVFEDFNDEIHEYTIWPAMAETKFYEHPIVKRYFEFHVLHLWTIRESITRFVDQNFQLHQFCEMYGIKHHFFSAFFVPKLPEDDFVKWGDINVRDVIQSLLSTPHHGWTDPLHNRLAEIERLLNEWDMIPDNVYINKQSGKSMKSYIEETIPEFEAWCGIHPSPIAHEAWSNYLYTFLANE